MDLELAKSVLKAFPLDMENLPEGVWRANQEGDAGEKPGRGASLFPAHQSPASRPCSGTLSPAVLVPSSKE